MIKLGDDYIITDENSANGTFVNGKRIRRAILPDGCEIRVGLTVLKFRKTSVVERREIRFCAKCKGSISTVEIKHGLYVEILGKVYCKECAGLTDSLVGRRIGKYLVLELIGKGGLGSVYKARRVDLNTIVALKVLHPEMARDDTSLKRFFREAKSGANLSHKNIARLIDVDSVGNLYYLAMEYVDGKSLAEVLKEEGPLDVATALEIAIQVADALRHAHSRGIIHRDLKPDNILLENGIVPKLVDLGLSKSLDTSSSGMITMAGIVMGTPSYMSPEQATDARLADTRSDIYSFGATLYHMLAGRPPFTGDNVLKIIRKVTTEQAPAPRSLKPEIPEEVERIILRCIEKEPEKRYQTMDEVLQDLQRIASEYSSQDG